MAGFAAAITAAAIAGDQAMSFMSNLIKLGDGSFITVQLDKPAYYAGETITGRVIAQINSPVTCDRVAVKIKAKEKVDWHDEIARTEYRGEGENRKAVTVYDHAHRHNKKKILQDLVIVSQINHMLPPGQWIYPFSYTLPPHLPGVVKFKRSEGAYRDPARHGEKKECTAQIVFSLKAVLDTRGVFSKDLKSKQEIVVNPYFDWAKMTPQASIKKAPVYWCCCFPQGDVTLDCRFDKGAYAAGETALITAAINNESKCNVGSMVVKLTRRITLNDSTGHSKSFYDVIATARYEGVPKLSSAARSLPLPLKGPTGNFLPSISGAQVKIEYVIEVECDISMAFDIEAHLPVVIYEPAPAVYGMAAVGMAGFTPVAGAGAMPGHF